MSFVADGLQTGNSLYPMQWGQSITFFLAQKDYERLKNLAPTPSITEKAEIADELLVEVDEFADHCRRNRPDVLKDKDWITSHDEPFNPREWVRVPLVGEGIGWRQDINDPVHPPRPAQEPRLPLEWDSRITDPPPVSPRDWYNFALRYSFTSNIPPILRIAKKCMAKSDPGKAGYRQKKLTECEARKNLFIYYKKLVGHTQSVSVDEGNEIVLHCSRCGGSIFPDEKHCFDCGKNMGRSILKKPPYEIEHVLREAGYTHVAGDNFSQSVLTFSTLDGHVGTQTIPLRAGDSLLEETPPKGRERRGKIKLDIMVRLLASTAKSKLYDLGDPQKLSQAANTARILTEQGDGTNLIAADVAQETGEALRAVESRCEIILRAYRECLAGGKIRQKSPLERSYFWRSFTPKLAASGASGPLALCLCNQQDTSTG